jgi:hypothetical protein
MELYKILFVENYFLQTLAAQLQSAFGKLPRGSSQYRTKAKKKKNKIK